LIKYGLITKPFRDKCSFVAMIGCGSLLIMFSSRVVSKAQWL